MRKMPGKRGKDPRNPRGPGRVASSRRAMEEREFVALALIRSRLSSREIVARMRADYKMSKRGAESLLARLLNQFRDRILKERMQWLLDGFITHVESLQECIRETMCEAMGKKNVTGKKDEMPRNPNAWGNVAEFQKQLALVMGFMSTGPTILINNQIGETDRIIVATKDQSKVRSVLSRMTKMNATQLNRLILKQLPRHESYNPEGYEGYLDGSPEAVDRDLVDVEAMVVSPDEEERQNQEALAALEA